MSRLTLGGNPAGQFPPCKDAALDAVFATAKPFDPGEVPIRVDGEEIFAPRAAALVWALGELDLYSRLNQLADSELVPTKLSLRFHAIAAAADMSRPVYAGALSSSIRSSARCAPSRTGSSSVIS